MGQQFNCFLALCVAIFSFASFRAAAAEASAVVAISVKDQKLAVIKDGKKVATYPVSTSMFGLGDSFGSYKTPAGVMMVCDKFGGNLQPGAVIRHRTPTGEVLPPDAPGRDPIVTRIICLRGLEAQNRNAFPRSIYIHGTPQESSIGKQASWGCIRMRSRDVIALYNEIGIGACVEVSEKKLSALVRTPVVIPPEGIHNLMATAVN